MKQLLGWIVLVSCVAVSLIAADDSPIVDDGSHSAGFDAFKLDQLADYLVNDKELSKLEPKSQALSAQYRSKVVRAVARYLAGGSNLSNLNRPDGRARFDSAWSKLKALCFQIQSVNSRGIAPKQLHEDTWLQLVKVTQYILNNKYILPDEAFAQLAGKRRG